MSRVVLHTRRAELSNFVPATMDARPRPRRQERDKEPAAHVRARKQRVADHMLCRVAFACMRLARHHGSEVPRILRSVGAHTGIGADEMYMNAEASIQRAEEEGLPAEAEGATKRAEEERLASDAAEAEAAKKAGRKLRRNGWYRKLQRRLRLPRRQRKNVVCARQQKLPRQRNELKRKSQCHRKLQRQLRLPRRQRRLEKLLMQRPEQLTKRL